MARSNLNFDWTIHVGDVLLGVIVPGLGWVGWRLYRAIERFEYLTREFPPHRHVNGRLIFPKGMAPHEEGKGS